MKDIVKIEPREFVKRFFLHYGATLEEKEGVLHISLETQQEEPSHLSQILGAETFHFVFDIKAVQEGLELLTPGHPILDRIHKFLQEQGRKTVLLLPKRQKNISISQAKKFFQPTNKLPFRVEIQNTYRDEVIFQFKVLYLSEKMREEELFEEGIQPNFSPISKKTGEIGEKWSKRWIPPIHFSDLYDKALSRVLERVRVRATHFEKQLWEEMKQTGIQLGEFYRYQMQEISQKESLTQKIAKLEEEQQQQLKHLAEKYRLSVEVFLIGYQVFRIPLKQFLFHYAKGTFTLEYDLFSAVWEPITCSNCLKTLNQYGVTESGQLLCEKCFKQCPFCQQEKTLTALCGVCQKSACSTCLSPCVHCGQLRCSNDLEKCSFCAEKICQNCLLACMLCSEKRGCPTHFFEFEQQSVCLSCGFTCKRCHHTWPRSKELKCRQCGQLFCWQCGGSCLVCQSVFCGNHSSCTNCGAQYEPSSGDSNKTSRGSSNHENSPRRS